MQFNAETGLHTNWLITRREAIASAEYWIHFIARFNGVHAFGYNSAGSEPIWMTFRALWAHCLPLVLADFERNMRRRESERARQRFVVFCEVNNAQLYRFSVGQISRNLHTRRGSVSRWILFEHNFANFPVRCRFCKKANLGPKSSTTCDFSLL